MELEEFPAPVSVVDAGREVAWVCSQVGVSTYDGSVPSVDDQVVVVFRSVPITVEFVETVGRLVVQSPALPVLRGPLLVVVKPPDVGNADKLALLKGKGVRVTVMVLVVCRVRTEASFAEAVVSGGSGYTVTVTTSVEMLTLRVSETVELGVTFVVLRFLVEVDKEDRLVVFCALETELVTLLLVGLVGTGVRVASVI